MKNNFLSLMGMRLRGRRMNDPEITRKSPGNHPVITPFSRLITSTLLLLFTFAIGNVWGADASFMMSSIFTGSNQSGTVMDPVKATVSTNVSKSNASTGKLGSDGNYFQVILDDDTFTAASFNGYINTTSTSKNWVFQFSTDGGSTWSSEVTQANDGNKSAHDIAVGVTVPSGANGFRVIRRTGTSCYVYSITFSLAAKCSAPTNPEIAGNTAYTEGEDISLTASADGATSATFTWYKGEDWATASAGSPIGFAAALTINTCTTSDAGTYWCNISNGTGCEVQVSEAIMVAAAGAVESHIFYEATKGATNTNPDTYYEGTGVASFDPLEDVTDFHFTGWNPASIAVDAIGDQTIEAQWVDAYNVSFSAGAGSGTVPTTFQKWDGAKFELPGQGEMVAPTGKVFDGWKANGTGDKFAAGAEYTMGAAAVEFVAQWKATPTVLFHYQWTGSGTQPSVDDVLNGTGGTITVERKDGSTKTLSNESAAFKAGVPNDMKFTGTTAKGIKFGTSDVYFHVALTSGKFQEGDTIKICGYESYIISTSNANNGNISSGLSTGADKNNYDVAWCVIPEVENCDLYIRRTASSSGFAAIKVIRPAEKDIASTVNTLTDVKVNGTSIAAGDLATLVSTHSLALDDAEATAPTITFNKHTVITYVDDTKKVTDTPIEETAADNGAGKWAASTTIDAVTYTVTLNIATSYHVTYNANGGDGIMTDENLYAEGDEVTVLDNEFTAPAANKKFNGWTSSPVVTISGEGKFEMPASDVELSAVWTEFFTITYKDGDETLSTEDVFVGSTPAGLSPAPTKPLYVFAGWVNDVDEDVDITTIATTTTVYVKWNKLYVPQGTNYVFENTATVGTAPNAITVTKNNQANAIAANSRIDNMWLSAMSVKLEDGTYSGEGNDFKGWKINTSGATIRFFVENDSRVTVTVGTLSSGMNIAYTGTDDAAHDVALSAATANVYNVKGGTLVTLATQGGSTVTLKGIAVTEIPAQSDDATLSDLKVGGVTVDGFSASKLDYSVELPYGSTSQPEVTATPNDANVTSVGIVQNIASLDDATITVTAEDGEHYNVYTVHFTVAPKLGVELIKATHTGTTTASKEGYWTADVTVDKKTQSKKLGGNDDYFGLTLAGGKTFKNNDIVVIYLDPTQTPSAWLQLFNDKGTNMIADVQSGVKKGANYITLTGLPEEGIDKLFLYRTGTAAGNMNPYVDYIAVYRLMAPFIEEFKIGEAVGTIDQDHKTIAVEVPYATDVTSLTPDIVAYANGGATLDKTGAQNFSSPVTYKVSSAYAEDGDVTYTVTVTVADHYEAMIVGGASYATLAEAVAAAQDGDVVKLLDNVDLMATGLTIAKNMTLDLNGFNIKAGERETNDIFVPAGVKLTLVDNSTDADGKIYTEEAYTGSATGYGLVRVSGELLMQSGNIYAVIDSDPANLGQFAVTLGAGGKVTIEGGQIKAGWYAIANNGNNTGSTIIVSGGELISTADYAIYNPAKESTVTVSGGVVYGAAGAIAMNRGELTVTGGTITSKGQGSTGSWGDGTGGLGNAAISANGRYESVSVEISGGTVIAEGNAIMITNGTVNPVEVAISGGQFSEVVPEEYCADGFAPVTTPNAQGKYEVIAAGIIRGAAVQDAEGVYYYTLDNDVTIYSSQSDGRLNTSSHISTSSNIEPCGGAEGGYNVNQSKFVLKFPVNVKEFTLYGANSTERTISTIHVSETASADYQIKIEANLITGTYTTTKDGNCQTLTAAFNDANIIPANYYVLVTFSGTANIYRVLYTEAECTTPTVTVADQTAKDGVEVTLTAEASALGATYQWYTCDDELGTNPVIMTGETAKTLSVIKSGADDQFYKVVVGCNCSAETAEEVAKVSLYTAVTTLVDVTENTVWDWTAITNDVDGNAIGSNGPTLNGANYILANYIQGNNMDKVEGNNGAYAIRGSGNKVYQGASLHIHTTKAGLLTVKAGNEGHDMVLKVANAGRDYELGALASTRKDYTVYVEAGDVTVYNVPASGTYPMRVEKMTFTVKESPDYTRDQMLGAGVYGTICVDHNVPEGGVRGVTVYEIAGREPQYGKIAFDEVTEMKAGVPYVFIAHGNEMALYYGETTVDDPVNGNGMYGTFVAQTLTELDGIYYFAKSALWSCVDLTSLNVPANRAYVKLSEIDYLGSSSPAPGRRRITLGVQGEQVATGFEDVQGDNVQCTKVLINGELFILRGEKMYDAKGQLVK